MADIRRSSANFNEAAEPEMMMEQPSQAKGPVAGKIFSVLIIIVIIILGLYFVSRFTSWNILGLNKSDSTWQAVFLSNGQVYFGNVASQSSRTVILKDIYYLQVNQQPIQPQDQTQPQQAPISLVKLGNELHGPYDEMFINRDQILFIENMKTSSKVVEAIMNYKKDQTKK
ncbi:MAG: hypothetical protein NTV81_04500 [Candidatus Komeilibacteria bacterium]|nr:hypothetical protein [Candidatus Komeilibacteria bacterium]